MDRQAALRRTVSNDYAPALPPPPPLFNIKPVSYDWDKTSHSESLSRSQSIRSSDHSRPRDYKVIPRSGMVFKICMVFKNYEIHFINDLLISLDKD
jgi:ribosomal protein L36